MMRADELRELPNEELLIRLDETKEELFNLRFQLATGQLENYKRVGLVKKDIAQMVTIVRERELGIEPEPEVLEARRRTREERVRRAEEEAAASEDEEQAESEPLSSPEEDTGSRRRLRRPKKSDAKTEADDSAGEES